ncbi:MAG TPA: ATP-grasp domain-containing protein [Methanolinea sp.]|nr:ATP-grasp domain-containing protein [Methanolinea sp.]
MNAFLAEYTVFHDPHLAPEGEAMLRVLSESFARCGYEVLTPEDGDFLGEIRRLAPLCEVGLVIAPDHLLFQFSSLLERLTHSVGCGSMNAAVCADKVRCGQILARNGVPVPGSGSTGTQVVKPALGCGSVGVRLTKEPPGKGEYAQDYIEGEHLSVSLVGSRVVGDACSFYTGKPPLLLAVNRQEIVVGDDGLFHYLGGETPLLHPRQEELVETATKAVQVLGCQGYVGVDIVLADRCYVVDVNPRVTTSIVGIAACMEEEIADILVQASRGGGPDEVHLNGKARFDSQGRVKRL